MKNRDQEARFDARTVRDTLYRTDFGSDLQDVSQRLPRPTVVQDADMWIRNEFRELVEHESPERAAKYMQSERVRNFLKAFPEQAGKFYDAAQAILKLEADRKAFESSAFARFATEDPETAIGKLFTMGNKVASARELVQKFQQDPTGEALEMLRAGVMRSFLDRTKFNPDTMNVVLSQRDVREMMQEIFSPPQMGRLDKIIRSARQLSDPAMMSRTKRTINAASTIFGRVIGAQLGRSVARRLGGGTVQTPAIFARALGTSVDNWVKGMPIQELIARAVIDPKFEKILWSKTPETIQEAEKFLLNLKSVVAATGVAGNELGLNPPPTPAEPK